MNVVASIPTVSFETWLAAQRERDDPVGDLARDQACDASWPKGATRKRQIAYLSSRGAEPGALDALRRARDEWRATPTEVTRAAPPAAAKRKRVSKVAEASAQAVEAAEPPKTAASAFLRWVGSKRGLASELLARVPERFEHYHEPFVGAGWLFWTLANARRLKKNYVSLSDTCEPLVRTWRGVKDDVESVISKVASYPLTEDDYYAVRAMGWTAFATDAEVASWFIYLNKTCVNGIWRVNKSGAMNVPWGRWEHHGRMPKVLDAAALRASAELLQHLRVSITVRPFEDVRNYARPGDLVYFDPPYLPTSQTSDFTSYTPGGFTYDDHVRLRDVARELKERGVSVMLSNSDVPLVRELYESWRGFKIEVALAARAVNSDPTKRGKVRELIIT